MSFLEQPRNCFSFKVPTQKMKIKRLLFLAILTLTVAHTLTIHLTKTTAAQNEVALSYRSVRGLYFLAVVFVISILLTVTRDRFSF